MLHTCQENNISVQTNMLSKRYYLRIYNSSKYHLPWIFWLCSKNSITVKYCIKCDGMTSSIPQIKKNNSRKCITPSCASHLKQLGRFQELPPEQVGEQTNHSYSGYMLLIFSSIVTRPTEKNATFWVAVLSASNFPTPFCVSLEVLQNKQKYEIKKTKYAPVIINRNY